ncbi:alpha/beta fold hydrolase [soil metagenome]
MSLARTTQQQEKASLASVFLRFVGILLFLALVGSLVWSLSVTSGIDAFETLVPADIAPGVVVTLPDGQAIHYQEVGSGPPILLLHDFDVAGGYQWQEVAASLSGYRVIIPDQADFGFSERLTEQSRQHTIVGRAATMAALFAELEIERAHVVGAGLGGTVAAQMAVDTPEMVERLVLIAPEIYEPPPTWTEFLYRLPLIGPALTYTTLGGGSRAVTNYSADCGAGWCPESVDLEYRQAAAMVQGTTAALVAMAATPGAATVPAKLSAIAALTLIIWGENDQVTSLADGRSLDEAVPDSTMEVLPATGHRPQLEDPAATAALIAEFLAS